MQITESQNIVKLNKYSQDICPETKYFSKQLLENSSFFCKNIFNIQN